MNQLFYRTRLAWANRNSPRLEGWYWRPNSCFLDYNVYGPFLTEVEAREDAWRNSALQDRAETLSIP